MRPPGKLLATGRDCDVFEYGPRLVLRRSRHGRSMSFEARIMDYVRGYGYPVPEVVEMSDDATAMVMERIEGPTMLGPLKSRPWRVRSYGAMLADLHIRLHDIPPPDFLEMSPVLARGPHLAPGPSPAERHDRPPWPGRHRLVQCREGRRCVRTRVLHGY